MSSVLRSPLMGRLAPVILLLFTTVAWQVEAMFFLPDVFWVTLPARFFVWVGHVLYVLCLIYAALLMFSQTREFLSPLLFRN